MSTDKGFVIFLFANGEIQTLNYDTKIVTAPHTKKIFLGGKNNICILCFGEKQVETLFSKSCDLDLLGDSIILRCVGENSYAPFASTEEDAKKIMREWMNMTTVVSQINNLGKVKYKVDISMNRYLFSDEEKIFIGILDTHAKKYTAHLVIKGILHCIQYKKAHLVKTGIVAQISEIYESAMKFWNQKKNDEKFMEWCDFCVTMAIIKSTIDRLLTRNSHMASLWEKTESVAKFMPVIDTEWNVYSCHINNMIIHYHPQIIKISFGEKYNYELSNCKGDTYAERMLSGLEWITYYCAANLADNKLPLFSQHGKLIISEFGIQENH